MRPVIDFYILKLSGIQSTSRELQFTRTRCRNEAFMAQEAPLELKLSARRGCVRSITEFRSVRVNNSLPIGGVGPLIIRFEQFVIEYYPAFEAPASEPGGIPNHLKGAAAPHATRSAIQFTKSTHPTHMAAATSD